MQGREKNVNALFSFALGFCFPLLEVRCPCWAARMMAPGSGSVASPSVPGACADPEQKAAPLSRGAQGGS